MTFLRIVLLPTILAWLIGAAPPQAPGHPDYYVMRHLPRQSAAEGGLDPGLTREGMVEAGGLVFWMAPHPPAAIYVTDTRRARETASSVAFRYHVRPKLYDPRDTAGHAARVKGETGTVLIVGHSNTVPDIVEALGGTRPAPLGDSDYGDIWHVWGEPRRTEKLRLPRSPPIPAPRLSPGVVPPKPHPSRPN